MKTERVMTLKNTYREALHCMLKLHVDAPWELAELNFHKRLQHQVKFLFLQQVNYNFFKIKYTIYLYTN